MFDASLSLSWEPALWFYMLKKAQETCEGERMQGSWACRVLRPEPAPLGLSHQSSGAGRKRAGG